MGERAGLLTDRGIRVRLGQDPLVLGRFWRPSLERHQWPEGCGRPLRKGRLGRLPRAGAKGGALVNRLRGALKPLRLALSTDAQVRDSVPVEESDRRLWRRLDHLPMRLVLPAALAVGTGLAWGVWALPDMLAAPLFLLVFGGAAALAFRGEPVLVAEPPASEPAPPKAPLGEREVRPAPPERLSLVPEDWWVDIPPGSFRMGSPENEPGRRDDEGPLHEVRVSAFRCLRYPVTKGLARRLDGASEAELGRDDPPLVDVSWLDAVRFCNRLSEADGLSPCYRFDGEDQVIWDRAADGYRLLTEAEWEYACRAGTRTRWWFGDGEAQLDEHAWYDKNSGYRLHPVGQKRPSPWGLHDMHGLVWEWCWDRYGPYPSDAQADPSGPQTGDSRVLRGGSFGGRAEDSRSAYRDRIRPENRDEFIGFRCARAPRRQA
jgi:formylglycine-generating enzyme required for sulfatase activity